MTQPALSSLESAFHLRFPQTSASFETRLTIIDSLRTSHPSVAWTLMRGVLPTSHGVVTQTRKPRWRPLESATSEPKTRGELASQIGQVVDRLLADANEDASKWSDIIKLMDGLPRESFDKVLGELQERADDLKEGDTTPLWESLRNLISHHASYPEATWSLDEATLEPLRSLYDALAPADRLTGVTWLFTAYPDLPEGDPLSLGEREEKVAAARAAALRPLVEDEGLGAVERLIELAESPWHVGRTLADLNPGAAVEFLSATLVADSLPHVAAGRGFVEGLTLGRVSRVEELLNANDWNDFQEGQILAALPLDMETAALVEAQSAETQKAFWKAVGPYSHGQPDRETIRWAGWGLVQSGTAEAATHFVCLYRESAGTELVAAAVDRLAAEPPTNPAIWGRLGHDLAALFEVLEGDPDSDADHLARLEWLFLPILSKVSFGYRPPALDRALSRDPALFIDLLSKVYRSKGGSANEQPSDDERMLAEQGFTLLHNWSTIPGNSETGIDEAELETWVTSVRELARASGRGPIADVKIGEVLAFSGDGTDGLWPHEAVRSIIESVRSSDVEDGFIVQLMNNRGVSSRDPYEGGHQEDERARMVDVQAQALQSSWPRTAACLRRLAESYRSDARMWDERAAEDRQRYE